mmetsp:Transcript_29237/g.52931  ORF Transcript_29237/g.52931 Transcript_29237/m.52931 type:complete len:237 (-) Transcript_29237:54-764(-)
MDIMVGPSHPINSGWGHPFFCKCNHRSESEHVHERDAPGRLRGIFWPRVHVLDLGLRERGQAVEAARRGPGEAAAGHAAPPGVRAVREHPGHGGGADGRGADRGHAGGQGAERAGAEPLPRRRRRGLRRRAAAGAPPGCRAGARHLRRAGQHQQRGLAPLRPAHRALPARPRPPARRGGGRRGPGQYEATRTKTMKIKNKCWGKRYIIQKYNKLTGREVLQPPYWIYIPYIFYYAA